MPSCPINCGVLLHKPRDSEDYFRMKIWENLGENLSLVVPNEGRTGHNLAHALLNHPPASVAQILLLASPSIPTRSGTGH